MPDALMLLNGRVLTQEASRATGDCVLIQGGRIAFSGLESEVNLPRAGIRTIDLHGKTVVPGFNDCHMHALPYGLDLARANLSPAAGVTSVGKLIQVLRAWAL